MAISSLLLRATKNLLDQPEYQVSGLASLLVARSQKPPPLNQPLLDQPDYFILSHVFLVAATCKQLLLELY